MHTTLRDRLSQKAALCTFKPRCALDVLTESVNTSLPGVDVVIDKHICCCVYSRGRFGRSVGEGLPERRRFVSRQA